MSWVKGDRLKVTLEITATEPSDEEVADIWYKTGTGTGHSYIDQYLIEAAGGTVTVEVIPKPVELPTKKWAQVIVASPLGRQILLTRVSATTWIALHKGEWDSEWTNDSAVGRYVRTISEGVDE